MSALPLLHCRCQAVTQFPSSAPRSATKQLSAVSDRCHRQSCAASDRSVQDAHIVTSVAPKAINRRAILLSAGAAASFSSLSLPAEAFGFKKELKKRKLTDEDYSEGPGGLRIAEINEGSGATVTRGDFVTVHYDCVFRGIDAVSSRSARLLGGNRTIAEPFTFTAGKRVGLAQKEAGESAGGLFSGQGGPKPPPALSTAVLGMKQGGKRSIQVPPELAYGREGQMEIPPDATIELKIEVLSIGANISQDD